MMLQYQVSRIQHLSTRGRSHSQNKYNGRQESFSVINFYIKHKNGHNNRQEILAEKLICFLTAF